MVPVTALWMPILASTVLVFITSNLIWMVLNLHKKDWKPLPDEEALAEVLNQQKVGEGEYTFPFADGAEDWKSEEWQKRFQRGPVGFLTLKTPGDMGMGKSMASWVIYIVILQIFIAYLTGHARAAGADFAAVFQIAGAAGVLGFAGAVAPEAIWLGRQWSNVLKTMFDGVVYGLLSAAVFAWLWPAAS